MLKERHCIEFVASLLTALGVFYGGAVAHASDAVPQTSLEAVARAFGFLESAPKDGIFAVAVVHANEENVAADAAHRLERLSGPNRAQLRATAYSIEAILQSTDHFDAMLLIPGQASQSQAMAEFAKDRRILSISNDQACLETRCCALMVSTDRNVKIVLDTRMAAEVGAQFSSVFTMMVTRR